MDIKQQTANSELTVRQDELRALAADPEVDSVVLENNAWAIVENVFYDHSEDDAQLLPLAYDLLRRLAESKNLRLRQSDHYFNARIALAMWGALTPYFREESPSDRIRLSMRRKLGSLLLETAGSDFRIDRLSDTAAQKMYETMVLGLLLRSPESSGLTGWPAPPYAQRAQGVNDYTGTTTFQLYAIDSSKVVPVCVGGFRQQLMEVRHKGVLLVALGQLLMTSAKIVSPVMEASKRQGNVIDGQRWMINMAANALGRAAIKDAASLPDPVNRWLDNTTRQLASFVTNFTPSNNSVPWL